MSKKRDYIFQYTISPRTRRENVFKHTVRKEGKEKERREVVSPWTRVIFVKDRNSRWLV